MIEKQHDIKYADMVAALVKSGDLIVSELTPENAHLLHMAVGIVGEAGEVLDALDQAMSFNTDLDLENVLEELGDTEFYIEGIRQGLGVTRDQVMEAIFQQDVLRLFGKRKLDALMVAIKYSIQTTNLLDMVKKVVIYQKKVATEEMVDILSKMEILLMMFRHLVGFQRDECLDHNIDKLGKRYKGFEYSDKAAQERADKAG